MAKIPKLIDLDDLKKLSSLRPTAKMVGNSLDIDSIYNHSIPKKVKKKVKNISDPGSEFKPFTYDTKNIDPAMGPIVLNDPMMNNALNSNKLYNPIYNNPHVPKEALDFDPNNPLSWTNEDISKMADGDKEIFDDLFEQRKSMMEGRVYNQRAEKIPEIDPVPAPSTSFKDAPDTEILDNSISTRGLSKMDIAMTGINVMGAIGDYKTARREGHGVVSSTVRAGAKFAIDEALGMWALPVALVKTVPGLAIKGADMLYKENRRMNSAANFQVFGGAQFMDTQQLATMRQSGMEMAKMANYNLQQTLMGNEATYLHR